MARDLTKPDPGVVLDLLEAFRRSKTMFAADALGVFDALAAGPKPVAALVTELKADAAALGRLLDALVGLRLLQTDAAGYANTPAAQTYLTSDSPERLTGYVRFSNAVTWNLWGHLEDAVREGTHRWKQAFGLDGPIFKSFFRTDESRREFLMGMHGFGRIGSPAVSNAVDLSRFRKLVDLGGATGHLAVAACERYPSLRAAVFDLPEAVPLAREMVGASSVADRVEILAGDFFADPLPPADLYALGRILHDWTDDKCLKLLTRVYEALPAGGAVLVVEKLLKDDASGPSWAQMQDLNMLTATEGRERTLGGYEELLKAAGFADVTGHRTSAPVDAVLGVKA